MKTLNNKISMIGLTALAFFILSSGLFAKSSHEEGYDSRSAIYYNQCVGCHGYKAEKSAFHRARPLRTLTENDLYNRISYYKNSKELTLTTEMLMNKQIKNLSHEDIKKVVSYILSLEETVKRSGEKIVKR